MIWCKDSPFFKFGRNSLEKDWLGIRQSSQLAPPFFCLFDLLYGKISWFWMSLMMTESFFFSKHGIVWKLHDCPKHDGVNMNKKRIWFSYGLSFNVSRFKVGFFRLTHGENMSFCEELLTVQRFLQSRCSLATNLQFGAHGMHKQCECCGTKDGVTGPLIGSLRGQWWFPARELQEDNDNQFQALHLFCLVPVLYVLVTGKTGELLSDGFWKFSSIGGIGYCFWSSYLNLFLWMFFLFFK